MKINFKRYRKCTECGEKRIFTLFDNKNTWCSCKICDEARELEYYRVMDEYYKEENEAKDKALEVFKKSKSEEDFELLKEFLQCESEEMSIGNFRIEESYSGRKDEDDFPLDVWFNQTTNGGYSGDYYSGTVYIKIESNKYIAYDYSC